MQKRLSKFKLWNLFSIFHQGYPLVPVPISFTISFQVEPSWKVLETVVSRTLQPVMNLDSLDSSHQISIPVGDPDDINEIFDAISYSKGWLSHYHSSSVQHPFCDNVLDINAFFLQLQGLPSSE